MTTSRSLALALTALSVSCTGNGSAELQGALVPACTWPAAADTVNAGTGAGCEAQARFQVCQVSSGGAESCQDSCTPAEYALTCTGESTGSMPAPDPSLKCKIIPVPTPPNKAFYCCPCS